MPGIFRFRQLRKSPRRHSRHVLSWPPCQPTPTRRPFFHAETPSPTSSMMPATSCPGTRGYCIPGHKPSFVSTSLWQTPQACTLMRTCLASGLGISRSTISKPAPGLGTCADFICAAFMGTTVALFAAINPPFTRWVIDARTCNFGSVLRCVTGEDKVASFDRLVAGEAGLEQRLVRGFAVSKLCETPAARRGVFSRVLHHELNVGGGPCHERLGTAKDFVVFLRRNVTPGQPGDDRAVRKRQLPFPVGLDRQIIAEKGSKIVEVAFFVGHGNQLPVAVSGGNFDSEDRGGFFISVSRCGGRRNDNAGHRRNCNQQESDQFHYDVLLPTCLFNPCVTWWVSHSASNQKRERETIRRWYCRYIGIDRRKQRRSMRLLKRTQQ